MNMLFPVAMLVVLVVFGTLLVVNLPKCQELLGSRIDEISNSGEARFDALHAGLMR